MHSLNRLSMLDWVFAPSESRGIYLPTGTDDFERKTYAALASDVRRVACAMAAHGIEHDDVVVLVLGSGPSFAAAFFGTLLAGATPAPIAPPAAFQDVGVYSTHWKNLLRAACPRIVVTEPMHLAALSSHGETIIVTIDELFANRDERADEAMPQPAELGVLQFTSGSTSRARGVRIALDSLERNIHAVGSWFGWRSEDAFASWLPVHHDMGLIAGLLLPIVYGCDLYSMPPEVFLRRPLRWLRCIGSGRVAGTLSPPFGLDYVLRKVSPEELEGLDFTALRALILGAERISPRTLHRFGEFLAPYGFSFASFKPAYGLAEATLCVTATHPEEPLVRACVTPESLAPGEHVVETDEAHRGETIVSCGRPIADQSVTIEDERGNALGDLRVGEIVVRGSCVARGYLTDSDDAEGRSTVLCDRTLRTGDAGFTRSGEVFVLGRLGDSIKIRGRFVFSEQIEASLVDAGLSPQGLAVLLGTHEGSPTAVAVLERPDADAVALASVALRRFAEGARTVVLDVRPGAIQRTSSGKPKRGALFAAFASGRLPAKRVGMDSRSSTPTKTRIEQEPADVARKD